MKDGVFVIVIRRGSGDLHNATVAESVHEAEAELLRMAEYEDMGKVEVYRLGEQVKFSCRRTAKINAVPAAAPGEE